MIEHKTPYEQYFYWLLKINKDIVNKDHSEQDKIWINQFTEIKDNINVEQIPKCLTLIHPDFFRKNGVSFSENLNWKTNTSFKTGITEMDRCCYDQISGKECEFNEYPDIRGKCEADHFWPNSLGGPSMLSNRLILCRFHNGMKSNDIDVFLWAKVPDWLEQYLQDIYNLKT